MGNEGAVVWTALRLYLSFHGSKSDPAGHPEPDCVVTLLQSLHLNIVSRIVTLSAAKGLKILRRAQNDNRLFLS